MCYSIYPTPDFKKQLKKLNKKYRSIKDDIKELIELLEKEPTLGIQLYDNVYKIRMAISSTNKGKSGGARIITYIITEDKELYFIAIFDKKQIDNISKNQIFELLKNSGLIT